MVDYNSTTEALSSQPILAKVLLIIIYIPAHLALAQAGRRFRDIIYPTKSIRTLVEDTEKRQKFDAVLQMNKGLGITLQNGIMLLSPLLTSLVSTILGASL